MNKKRYIIVIVLLIFLGLTIFAFANPGKDNELEGTNPGTQEEQGSSEEDKKQEEINTNTVVKKDNSYDLALEAVIDAEVKLDEESYNKALELVEKVKQNKKKELEERLEAVKEALDVAALVKSLEEKATSAASIEDMDVAREYRNSEDIINRVSNLSNEELKTSLTEKLTSLALLLDDTEAPKINIEDEAILAENTKVLVEDENQFTLTLKKDGSDIEEEIENQTELTDGVYTLTVIDKAFNETTVSFIIDTTDPMISGLDEDYTDQDVTLTVSDENLNTVTINDVEQTHEGKTFVYDLLEEGEFTVVATDIAGNTVTDTIVVDKTAPVFTTVGNGLQYDSSVKVEVEDLTLKEIQLYSYNDSTTVTIENGYEITEDGTYAITAIDSLGKETKVYVEIDTTDPIIGGLDLYYTDQDVTLTVSDKNLNTVTINDVGQTHDGKTFTVVLDEEVEFVVVATDKAGNTVTDTVIVDKTAPIFTELKDGEHYNQITVDVEDLTLTKITLFDGETTEEVANGYEITEEGTYTITAIDALGKETAVTVTLDTTAPTLTTDFDIDFDVDFDFNTGLDIDIIVTQKIIADEEVRILDTELGLDTEYATEFDVSFSVKDIADLQGHTITVEDRAGNIQTIDNIYIPVSE